MDRLDYPLHNIIKKVQSIGLYSIYHPRRLSRLQDNELRYTADDKFTMRELFSSTTDSLWEEVSNNKNINSFRRDLQTTYLGLLEIIILSDNIGFPNDAKLLARYNLKEILKAIYEGLGSTSINEYTKAHLENSAENIEAILEAKLSLN